MKNCKSVRTILVVCILLSLSALALHAQSPTINSVSAINKGQWQTLRIKGTNFGTQAPYIGNSAYIALYDVTGVWVAGYVGPGSGAECGSSVDDGVTLIVDYWSDSEIVIGGWSGLWGDFDYVLKAGDTETVCVWNAQSGAGPAVKTVLVH
jgi:hypothetical protein